MASQKLAEITPPFFFRSITLPVLRTISDIITTIKCYISWYNYICCVCKAKKTIVDSDLQKKFQWKRRSCKCSIKGAIRS